MNHKQSLQQEFDLRTKRGREIPQSLKDDLLDAKNRIVKTQADLDASTKELEDVKARYATDKVRYRELKGLAPDTTKNQTAPAKK